MAKLTHPEFVSLLKLLLIDIMYPEFIHIPGLGVRMPYQSYVNFSNDLYKAYLEKGEAGLVLFFDKLKNNPAIISTVERSKKLIYSHINTLGIEDEQEKQKYISGVINSVSCK